LFTAVLDYALSHLHQSTGDNLLGFQIDADAALAEEALLSEPGVDRTEDPRERLVLTLVPSLGASWEF
jgi:hypothetical protein